VDLIRKTFGRIFLVATGLILTGTLVYHFGWKLSWVDAVYMTVITISTVGYGEIGGDLNQGGRIFTTFLILGGFGVLAYAAGSVTSFIVEGHLSQILRRRKMDKMIERMKDHYIICGIGRTGSHIATELGKTKRPFVVVDDKEDVILAHRERVGFDYPYVVGSAADDDVLVRAGIERAAGLATALPEDKDNIFVVVSARGLNPHLRIISKLVSPETEPKLIRAGASQVVSPTAIGGLRMVSVLIRPTVVTFLDIMLRGEKALRIEEAPIRPGSSLIGKTLEQAELRRQTGSVVVAIQQSDGKTYEYNPHPDRKFAEGDTLIALGSPDEIGKLRKLGGGV
jgi:voltage-gated potassium channel